MGDAGLVDFQKFVPESRAERSDVTAFSEVPRDEGTLTCSLRTEQSVSTWLSVQLFPTRHSPSERRIGAHLRSHCAREKVSGWESRPTESTPPFLLGRAVACLWNRADCRGGNQEPLSLWARLKETEQRLPTQAGPREGRFSDGRLPPRLSARRRLCSEPGACLRLGFWAFV